MTRLFALLIWPAILIASPLLAANSVLDETSLVIPKEAGNMIEIVKTYLRPRAEDGQCKIWVFFTDKNLADHSGFETAASQVRLSDRTWWRREKVNRDRVTFADLPVPGRYINEILRRGAVLRRVSRWLNAASFEIDLAKIDEIDRLPFVARVRPVATGRTPDPVSVSESVPGDAVSMALSSLSYGSSLAQVTQLHVPALHDMGYNGTGIIVAMFDTGYLKTHEAFASAFSQGRVLAEYDFVFDDFNTQNETGVDASDQHDHGTYCWSTLGGASSGRLYGPAYGASFILAKTEDVRSETQVEEDNWVAAVEWADSIGADVISSSLLYMDWYDYSDYDGQTAVITIAANLATQYGIVVCNAVGNEGSQPGTLGAPADAFEILACGAVNSSGLIAAFSSRGPSYDGRIKPEVCARGVDTYCATTGADYTYGGVGGTSLATPLVGGCAALLLSIYPTMTPQAVRLALMETASRASSPDNTYGWGIVNMEAVLNWGAKIGSSLRSGQAPLEVNFYDSSYVPTVDWKWYFGDDDSSLAQNPTHLYASPGLYQIEMDVTTTIGRNLVNFEPHYILAHADTLYFGEDSAYAGQGAVVEILLTNTQALSSIIIPVTFSGQFDMVLDSISVVGTRGSGFGTVQASGSQASARLLTLSGGTPLSAGSGSILRLHFSIDAEAPGGGINLVDTTSIDDSRLQLSTGVVEYVPYVKPGAVATYQARRGDANGDDAINVGDPVYLVNFIFKNGSPPDVTRAGDANADGNVNVGDVVYLMTYIFHDGPPPPEK